MEACYLLCSIISTSATSAFCSVALAIRSLPTLLFSPSQPRRDIADEAVRLYEGRVRHVRRRPVHHAFEYPVRYALIDLDREPQPSHLSANRAREYAETNGPVFLLTIPASVGYKQNPLSVYYCYDVIREEYKDGRAGSQLKICIAEVTNTPWGEKVMFTFSPGSDLVAKPLHVSPFMDMLGNWSIRASSPGTDLYLTITVQHPTLGTYFNATLSAKQITCAPRPSNLAIYFWLMPHKVAIWIYWQALILWWKGVNFIGHPKYMSPMYREEAQKRDKDMHCSLKGGESDSNFLMCVSCEGNKNRRHAWIDAQWPWS